eukprot:CAMPEP_0170472922 /NCGR_PEP_ID=MMETSP0123-20130129/14895_1 /TAXON_ID=182087 /ORGANISM="Favella ehrenbergii, Strain Fehren 1" /LENGTH=133 /DNA_ID=CAMNT_0010741561 /DNA_START=141 /DNA_END=542 /DNA_ORIENTATION=-
MSVLNHPEIETSSNCVGGKVESVQRMNELAQWEWIEREKHERRLRFYREYANSQLARIITSLCQKNEDLAREKIQSLVSPGSSGVYSPTNAAVELDETMQTDSEAREDRILNNIVTNFMSQSIAGDEQSASQL